MGLSVTLEGDHKPLVPLLKTTELAKMSPRIQQFRMRLKQYSPDVTYVPGKQQTTPVMLSRAPGNFPEKIDIMFMEEVECYMKHTVTFVQHRNKTKYVQMYSNIAMKGGQPSCLKFPYSVHAGRAEAISPLSMTCCSTMNK